MTPREDTVSTEPEQVESLRVTLPGGLVAEVADTWANRRAMMILLRSVQTPEGRSLMTYEQIAQALGYADRRNVQNYWAEFEACGQQEFTPSPDSHHDTPRLHGASVQVDVYFTRY